MPSDSSNPFGVPGSFRRPNENGGNAPKPNNDQNQTSNSDKPTPPEEHGSNPFVVPGNKRSAESTIGGSQTRIKPFTTDAIGAKEGSVDQHDRTDGPQEQLTRTASPSQQGSANHTPFVWGVPNKPTKTGQEVDLDNESPHPSVKSPASSDHGNGDGDHRSTQINDNDDRTSDYHNDNDALASPFHPVGLNPTMTSPTHETGDSSYQADHSNPTHRTEIGGNDTVGTIGHLNHTDHHDQRSQQAVADLHEHKVLGDQPEVSDSHLDLQTDVEFHGSAPTGVLDVDHHSIKQDTRNMQEAATATPAASDRGSSDKSQNAGINPRLDARQTAASGVNTRRHKVNTSGVDYSGLLDGIEDPTEDEDNDDPFGINGFNEEWSPTPDDDPSLGVFDGSGVDGEDSGDDGDDDDPFGINGYLDDEMDGGSGSTATGQDGAGGSYAVDSSKLREGVQIGTVKRELRDFIHNPKIVDKAIARKIQLLEYNKKMRIPFSPQLPKILDFLTRWRIGTTLQLARIAGWKDSNEWRLVKKLRVYDEVGFMRETDIYAGPKIWTAKEHGAELGMHPWLGGVKSSEINPMSQSHTFGLSSIASWLLCPRDNAPNILGLSPDEWNKVRGEIKDGTAYVLAEKEYRSSYSSLRNASKGLLPSEYRHGFIGYAGGQLNPVSGAWQEWALAYKNGDATLDESPELLACDPEFMGANLWMWIIWGNSVWNPKVLEDRAGLEEGIDLDDPEWSGRDGELRLRSEFRRYGYVDIEERLDYATNKPMINKELGDRFALWDHLPDMIIARRRTDDEYADPQSIAIELELSAKSNSDVYARTMAAYGSPLGQTLYRKVIWLVPSKTIADRIRAGANKVGMILGEDYDIVPFVTSNKASVVKKSFYSGADILPGKWSKRGIIEPCEFDRSIPLS